MVSKQNFTVSMDSHVVTRFRQYCEEKKIQKGGLAERLIKSFLDGETFTPSQVGEIAVSE